MIVKEMWPNKLGFDVVDHSGSEPIELAEVHLIPGQPYIGVRSWRTEKSMAFPKTVKILGSSLDLDPAADIIRLLDITDRFGEDLH